MKSMQHSELQQTTEALFKQHPILGFLFCIAGISTSTMLAADVAHWELPIIIMQIGQVIAWLFVYITGSITILNAIEKWFDIKIKLNFFKKNKKNIKKK